MADAATYSGLAKTALKSHPKRSSFSCQVHCSSSTGVRTLIREDNAWTCCTYALPGILHSCLLMTSSVLCCCGAVNQSGSVEQHRDVLERPCASAALAGLLGFAALTSDSSGLGKHQLALYDPGRWAACLVFYITVQHGMCWLGLSHIGIELCGWWLTQRVAVLR